jgi:S1-C subfamily serine protease
LRRGLAASGVATVGVVGLFALAVVGRNPTTPTRFGSGSSSLDAVVSVVVQSEATGSASSVGSGVSMGSGIVVTSAELLSAGTDVRVNNAPATVLSVDRSSDIAILSTPITLPAAVLAGSARVHAGDSLRIATAAVGNSETGMTLFARSASDSGLSRITTNVDSKPTMVGSAALGSDGSVAGLVSGIRGANDTLTITPIEKVREVVAHIRRPSTSNRTLGISVTLGVAGPEVQAVLPERPAARAGIQPGDVIVAVGTTTVPSLDALVAAVQAVPAESDVVLMILRDGTRIAVSITPES